MGIKCLGFEIVCDGCGKSAGKFDTFEQAEAHVPADWAYWIPSFETECNPCKSKSKRDGACEEDR